jgi:hypothetical protein
MRNSVSYFFIFILLFSSCSKDKELPRIEQENNINSILMLQVDYLTNTFEGGTETSFSVHTTNFTITNEFQTPSDFGNLKLIYKELNKVIFDGDIIWSGIGLINIPNSISPAAQFNKFNIAFYLPKGGFQNVFYADTKSYDYLPIWQSIYNLSRVNYYLVSNPNTSIKIFLYTPSVGIGNPADWKWIIFIKS